MPETRRRQNVILSNRAHKKAVKEKTMKTLQPIVAIVVSAGLAFGVAAQAKEHEEENIAAADVPAAVQKAAETEAKGGTIVRWEKEGGNYEAVIDKDGKKWGVKISPTGKVMGKHDESKEKGEKD
jgi:plastocyanin